ncbi:hypothetical protein O181_048740 [Austropuccinia psidii MF-1]|uniref:Uncharacterized protein n=1 Tax=Austropuccinia psidii MF-1 TaxID=1389203 RepID=A0A9Q3DSF6_9BASI|nr:hypothetical protein [Austropuccinia psidii MF-1]
MVHGTVRPLLDQFQQGQKGPRGQFRNLQSQVGPPEPVFDPKTQLRTQIGHKSVHGLWQPSEATRSAPSKDSPPVQGKAFLSSMLSVLRDQEWCIYGIIYHYAPFLLSNPMVKLPGPNYMIPNKVPNPSPISKEDFSAIQYGNSLAATRGPFKDPNHLALQELGCQFSSGLF